MSLEMATDSTAGPNEQSLLTATDGNMDGNQGYDDAEASRLSYFGSVDFAELLACASFLVAGLVLESEGLSPTTRPMPYIQLESSGEYVVNQVFNEEFNGETVSSKYPVNQQTAPYPTEYPFTISLYLSIHIYI